MNHTKLISISLKAAASIAAIGIFVCAQASGPMLKCTDEKGRVEFRNTTWADPSCVPMSKARVNSTFSKVPVKIGMSKETVLSMWGQPVQSKFREMPEGRIEAWLYQDGSSLGFRDNVLVLIEGTAFQ